LADAPTHGGEHPHITITVDYDDLRKRIGAAYLELRCPIVPGQPGHYGGVTGMGEIGVEKTQELLSRIQG
ncbi:MAG TPA: hypothetical protein VIY86_07345, partial [Pirellulaceae bacterium]